MSQDTTAEVAVSEEALKLPNRDQLGYHPMIWMQALYKRITECEAGRGGVEALCQFADQIDFIPDLKPLVAEMKFGTIFYETALAKCGKDLLKRPVPIREDECVNMLGCSCSNPKCCYTSSIRMLFNLNEICPKCGYRLELRYCIVLMNMISDGMDPTPEAVAMNVAHDRLADAYVAAYKVLKKILDYTADIFGWDRFRIDDPQLRNYLDSYHLGRLAGDSKTPREEKEVLQFLSRGCMVGDIVLEDAENLIRLGMGVLKYGYIYQVLGVTGAELLYQETLQKFSEIYNRMSEKIRLSNLDIVDSVSRPEITVDGVKEGYYSPGFIMPSEYWESGRISKDVILHPEYKFPVFSKQDFGALQMAYSRL